MTPFANLLLVDEALFFLVPYVKLPRYDLRSA